MAINESAENYLETILMLSKSHPVVRSVDIAEELGYKKSSVSVAMKNLRQSGLKTETGSFGADMKVSLINDGPVTVELEI